jgi:autotransporter-associated beta strand protein
VIANGSTVNMPIFREVGTGTWTLSGTNTYSGMTTVNSGTLALKGGGKLASTGLVVNAGGSFVIHNSALANDTNRWVDTAAVTLNSGVFNFSHTGGEADYSEKAAGLVVVNGASTLSASQADVGRTSVVSFASLTRTGSGTINFTGEGLGLSEQNKILFTNMVASTNFIGLWATYNTTNLAAYDVTMGIIPASATAFTNLTAKGPSIIPDNQTLNARINEEGTSGGISLEGAKTNKINSLLQNTIFAATVAMTNKTLLVSDIMMAFDTGALTLGSAPSQGFLAPLVASGQLQLINQSTNVLTINASITNNTGASSLNKIGSGVVVLTGTNTYTGPTTIQQGVLEFGGSSTQIRSGVISGSGTLAKSGSGTLTLSAGNNYTGPTTISGGTLKAGNAAALGSATVGTTITSGGTLDVNGFNLGDEVVTVAGAGIGNAGAIINSSATTDSQNAFRFVTMTDDTTFGGSRRWDIRNNPTATFDMGGKTLTKTGANWFVLVQANVLNPGAFNIKQGAIQLANTMTMGGSSANRVTVQSGASLDLYALPTPITWSLALSNNATVAISAGTGTQNTWSGPVMLNGTGVLASATFVMTLSGPITGTGPLQKTGTGTATLSGTSTYGGGTIVTAGTLQLGDGTTASGMISGDVTNLATLAFSNPTTTTYSGVIRGVGAVTKQVNSTQILSGANTYSGATTVNAGTLLVNSPGSLSNSAVSVSSGASLGGNGTIYGIVNMAAGSILVPGDTNVIATLTLGNNSATSLTLNGNTLRFDLAAGDGDKIAITGGSGNVVVNGVNIVDLNFTAGSLPEGTYTLMTFASKTGSGAFALAQGYPNATLTADTTSLVLTVGEGGTTYGGLTWKGNTSSIWDAMADKNWTAQGIATNFTAADWVTFTDTASRFTVNSLGPVVPSSILFNNSANAYTVAAAIDGTAALVKQGTSTVTLSGVSTYNPSSLSIGAGTLALAGASQLNSGLYAANINNFGTFNYASSATQTLSGAVSGSGLLTVSGLGSLTLAGTNTFTGNLTVNNGTLVLTGSNALTTATVNVGATAVNNAVMKLTSGSSLIGTTGNFTVGSVDNGYGAVYIDGGRVVRAAPATIDGAFCFGTVAGGYGYFNMSNGDISSTRFQLGSGMGLARIANGIASFSEYIIFPRSAGSTGVLTIDGGSLYHTNASQNVALGYDGGRAELNMTGGLLDSTGKSLTVRQGSSNPTGIVSLCSGTLIVDNFQNTSPGVALLNFNGGLLTASEFSVAFLPSTMTGVYVNGPFGANAGGAMIDSAGRDITCVAPLRAPTGNGVTAISLSSQGSGYIGEPYVSIMGDGVGATAVANMVDDGTGNGTYKVGSVTVTSPGVNYTTATVSFLKGGASAGSPIVAAVTLAPTTSGGLTKLGLGTLTLSGTNTYTGTTTISNGAVRLGIANALPTNSVVNVRGGTYDLNGFSVTNGAINTTAGVIGSGSLNCAGINKDGDGLVTFTATQTAASPVIINGGTFSLGGAAAGLFEGRVNGAFELTLPNPKTAVRLSPVNAYTPVLTSPQTGGIWVDNSTYVYTGYIWNRSTNNATWTFCKNFDDGVLIKVDSTVLLNNNTWTLVQTTNYVMTPGPHAFEVRLGQGTGGVGQPAKRTPGAGFDPLGRSDATLCVPIIDPGDGSLLTLFADPYAAGSLPKRAGKLADASTVELAANTLLDLGTTNQTLAALSGSGAVSNGALTVTGTISPAGTNSFGTLTVKTNTTATLSGKLLVDVNATTNDFLVVEGSLTLSPSATVEIVDLLGLNTLKTYTLITSANPIVGTFADTTIPNPLWALRYTTDNKVQLYYKGGTMIRIM